MLRRRLVEGRVRALWLQERFVCLFVGTRGTRKRDETDVQITIGVACATFPTSSSFCIIFLMRACMFVCMHINWHVAKLIREFLER